MQVIALEEAAFYELYARLAADLKTQLKPKLRDKWIGPAEAVAMLRIKSKTTLQ